MRTQLVNDAFSLSQANKIDSTKPFELIKYLSKEREYLPWSLFIKNLDFYHDMISTTEINGDFSNFLLDLVEPIYLSLKWDDHKNEPWLKR